VLTVHALSAVPAATLAHLPVPAAHAWHVPHIAVEQQTLSTQLFEAHSVPAWHISPRAFLVGIFMHFFDDVLQTKPVSQSVSAVHCVTHTVPTQA
jgi:hypothetical protein